MRAIHNLTTVLGSLAVAWTLALTPFGVRAVAAGEVGDPHEVTEVAEGAVCEMDPIESSHRVVDSLQYVQRIAIERLAARLSQHEPAPGYVELDNRGHNDP